MSINDTQVGGDHYTVLSVQPWTAMSSWMTPQAFCGYLKGNVIKYVARDKGGLEDLKKARHYLNKLIEEMEAAQTRVNKEVPLTVGEYK